MKTVETIKIGEIEMTLETMDLLGNGKTLISRKDFLNIVLTNDKCRLFSMVTKTPVNMNQYLNYWLMNPETGKRTKNPNPTVNPYFEKGIDCVSNRHTLVTNFDYFRSLNNRLLSEGKEQRSEGEKGETWYEHYQNHLSVVVDKKTHTKFYLQYQYTDKSISQLTYFYDGQPIEKSLFDMYLPPKGDYSGQGLDNTLNIQVVNIDNILEVSFNNKKYILYDSVGD